MDGAYVVNRPLLKRPTTWVAAALWLFILGTAAAIVAMKANGWQGAGNTSDTSGVALFCALFAFATMGALVAAHVPGNAIGWIFLGIPLGGALAGITENLAFQGLYHDPGSVPGATAFAWVYAWVWYPTVGLLGFVLLLYPTGKVPGPHWRFVSWALGVVLAVMTLGYMFYPGPLDKDTRLPDNPLGIETLRGVFDRSDNAASISVAGLVLAAVISVIVRFRRSRGDERQQMKWMAFAAAVLGAGFVLQGVFGFGDVTFAVAISTLPVALGIALFRYRLYDIDRLINRTLVYGVSSALLGGAYVGLVIASEAVFEPIAGGSSVAVALSTLVVAGLFLPVRTRVQRFVDRRFYRSKVNAEETLARFGAQLRRESDLDTILGELHSAVREAIQPAQVWLWLRPEEPGP
jgi:hypothetical protein